MSYLAKREYRYDVQMKSVGYGFGIGNFAWSMAIYMKKRMVFWPLPVFWGLSAMYLQPIFFQIHNKKIFDMCNVGENYYLGAHRNRVLGECNKIQDREDF